MRQTVWLKVEDLQAGDEVTVSLADFTDVRELDGFWGGTREGGFVLFLYGRAGLEMMFFPAGPTPEWYNVKARHLQLRRRIAEPRTLVESTA